MQNKSVAQIFRNIAELLEIKQDNPFRIRAYIRAAENLENLGQDIEKLSREEKLEELPGIGRDLAAKIKEILKTGRCAYYEELQKLIPESVVLMLEIPSVGPRSAWLFYNKLKIKSIDELEVAAKSGKLEGLEGIKEKTVANILKGIELLKKGRQRMDLLTATAVAEGFINRLRESRDVKKAMAAGSLRRMKETVRDIDILVTSSYPERVMKLFVGSPEVKKILVQGETKASVLTKLGIQVDLRVWEEKSFGAALLYFTGSKNHNIRLRQLAQKKKLKINEYGIFDIRQHCVASQTEEGLYQHLGLDFIDPELREDAGEIEAAQYHKLPRLVLLKDVKGDFHAHTNYSDGANSVEEVARAALALGYEYICLTDHSQSLKVAHGLDSRRLKKKKEEIDRVQARLKKIRILFGTEVEIDAQGHIDYKDSVLSEFDVVVAAIHSGFKQSREQLTQRIIRACENKHVHIIAHPTGKLRPTRDSYDLDFDQILEVARQTHTALEINAHPYRLDLSDVLARRAKEQKVVCALGTDAHAKEHLTYMKFGVGLARRGWLQKQDVLNTLGVDELLKKIKK